MEIYIARHGQNQDNAKGILNGHRDLPLTALGRTQARDTAIEINSRTLQFDVVLSSPLKRALETAMIISGEISGPDVITEKLLIERDFLRTEVDGCVESSACSGCHSSAGCDMTNSTGQAFFVTEKGKAYARVGGGSR